MPLTNSRVVSILKELMEVCMDGEQGYKNAADDVKEKELAAMLLSHSRQRGSFVNELRNTINRLGGTTEFSGSILGILHRRWMDIKFGVAGSNPDPVLSECLRGERIALKKYEIHLAQDLPSDIKDMVKKQYESITEAHNHIAKLLEKHTEGVESNRLSWERKIF